MGALLDALIPIRGILKKIGSLYSPTTYRPWLAIEGDGVTYEDDPTYVDPISGVRVGRTKVIIAGSDGSAGTVESPVDTITEDATPVTLATLTAAEDGVRVWEVAVTAVESGGAARVWTATVTGKIETGDAIYVGSAPSFTSIANDPSFGTAVPSLDEVGGTETIAIIATGEAATDISWRTRIRRIV
jgi:hypothetical protein